MRRLALFGVVATVFALWACGGEGVVVGNGAWTGELSETLRGGPGGLDGFTLMVDLRVVRGGGQFEIVGSAARLIDPGTGLVDTSHVSGSINENIVQFDCVFESSDNRGAGKEFVVSVTGPIVGNVITGTYTARLGQTIVSSGDIMLDRFATQSLNVEGFWSGTYIETFRTEGELQGTWELEIIQKGSTFSVNGMIDEHLVDGFGSVIGNTVSISTLNDNLVFWLGEVNGNTISGELWSSGWGSGTFSFTGSR